MLVKQIAARVALVLCFSSLLVGCNDEQTTATKPSAVNPTSAPKVASSATPVVDPNGPWTIPATGSLTAEQASYAAVCVTWNSVTSGFPDLWSSNIGGLAAATHNHGLMSAVDNVSRDIATIGNAGATSTESMDQYCADVDLSAN